MQWIGLAVIFTGLLCLQKSAVDIEIDNDERGVIGDFTTISDIRITKAKPE